MSNYQKTKKENYKKITNNKEIKEEFMEASTTEDNIFKSPKRDKKCRFYFGFGHRVVIDIILSIIFIVILSISALMSFSISKNEIVTYKEKSNIDYKVYLKENDFYESPYLNKGMAYVASLIDRISINYNYALDISKNSSLDIDYKIVGRLVIASQNNSNIFYEKEYDLTNNIHEEINNSTSYVIDKNVNIDYSYYNDLANRFRSNYAINTVSYLEVYLKVNEKSKEENSYELINENRASLTIPLSEQEINIVLDNKDINETNQVVSKSTFTIKNVKYLIISVISFVLLIIVIIKLIKKIFALIKNRYTAYDRYIARILRGYDRIIVNVKTAPILDNYNVIKVESFQELIDVRDNVKSPINYHVITKHQKSEFFIMTNNTLYLYVVKSVDINGDASNEKK